MSDQGNPIRQEGGRKVSAAERRVRVRYSSNMLTLCQTEVAQVDDFWWSAKVRDISETGIGLTSKRSFEPGTILVIEPLRLSRSSSCVLPQAKVVRVAKQPNGVWAVGCEFMGKLSPEDLKAMIGAE